MLEIDYKLEEILRECNIDLRHLRKVSEFYGISSSFLGKSKKVYDFCCGNGLFGFYFALVNPNIEVVQLDIRLSNKYRRLKDEIEKINKIENCRIILSDVRKFIPEQDFSLYGIHSCGELSEIIVNLALKMKLPFSIIPCCQEKNSKYGRVYFENKLYQRVIDSGYDIKVDFVSKKITKANKLIMGLPHN